MHTAIELWLKSVELQIVEYLVVFENINLVVTMKKQQENIIRSRLATDECMHLTSWFD